MQFHGNKTNRLAAFLAVAALAFLPTGCLLFRGASDPFPAAVQEDPKIRPGITLKITVITAGKPEDNVVTVTKPAGEVTLPLISPVKCDGMTLQELQERLKKEHAQFIHDPQITVQFLPLADGMLSPWGTVIVKGKVGKEGPVNIPQTCDLTVTRALQLAGNATVLGNQNAVKITRTKNGKKYFKEVDVEAIGKYGMKEDDILLQDGDVIWVPEITW